MAVGIPVETPAANPAAFTAMRDAIGAALTNDNIGALIPNFAAAVAKVQSGDSDASIALLGDSLSFGTGATSRAYGYAQALADELTAQGIAAQCDSIWGTPPGFSVASLAVYDSRFTASGSSWSGSIQSINSNMFSNTTDTVDWIAWTPTKQVNRFDLWYPVDPQFGVLSVSVDDGAVQQINLAQRNGVWTWDGAAWTQTTAPGAAATAFGKAQINITTVGTHTLKIRRVSGNVKLSGIHGYRSDVRQVAIFNWGRPGETTTGWATGTSYWNYRGAMGQALKPDLTIVELGKNDENTGVLPAATQANLALIYAVAQTAPAKDVVAVVTSSSATSAIPQATQDATRAAVKAAAAAAGVPVILNHPARYGEYAAGNARGLYAPSDSTHLSNVGYRAKARADVRLLLAGS